MRASLDGSRTTNLSPGERPVRFPVRATSAPVLARLLSFRRKLSSISRATGRLRWAGPVLVNPFRSKIVSLACIGRWFLYAERRGESTVNYEVYEVDSSVKAWRLSDVFYDA